jgi:peptidoglycan/xylan/chitin deacetylase (PgdA/CDA1 family)
VKLWERVEYSAIVDRKPLRLPGNGRVVVWPIVTVEVWDPDRPLPRTVLSPPAGGAFVPDVPNWTWAEYGMRVGFWRVKAVLDRLAVTPTLSLNAMVCDRYPRVAAAALEAGWEFMAHSFEQWPMHALDDERDTIRRTMARISDFTGTDPRGWMGPGLTQTHETPELLVEAGIEYVADWVLDDQPCAIRTAAGPLYALPYTVELNDIPLMSLQNHRSAELFDRAMDQFETLYEEGAESARVMAIAVHPYIHGVPHRIRHYARLIETLHARPGVLFWTGAQILDWYKSAI